MSSQFGEAQATLFTCSCVELFTTAQLASVRGRRTINLRHPLFDPPPRRPSLHPRSGIKTKTATPLLCLRNVILVCDNATLSSSSTVFVCLNIGKWGHRSFLHRKPPLDSNYSTLDIPAFVRRSRFEWVEAFSIVYTEKDYLVFWELCFALNHGVCAWDVGEKVFELGFRSPLRQKGATVRSWSRALETYHLHSTQ